MNNLVNIKKEFSPDTDFWELNPHMTIIPPFSKAYQALSRDESSKLMWSVFFLREPDEEINKFFRFGEEKTIEILKETYVKEYKFWNTPIFKECLEQYPEMCLNAIQRSFLLKKESLTKRAKFLNEAAYNFANMSKLDLAHSKTLSIYKDYEEVEKKFLAQKEDATLRGGRKLSKSEKREI
jgi:hypothetical protein